MMDTYSWLFHQSNHTFPKRILSILLIVLFLLFISCQKDTPDTTTAHHGKLKRVLYYWTNRDTVPNYISDYEYDSKNRLVKIQNQGYTQLLKYNQAEQLIGKYGYTINGDGSTLSDSISYTYQNGNLVNEEWNFEQPINYSKSSIQTRYEYENSKLIRKKEYRDHQFWRLTLYEYSGSLCTHENQYNDSIGTEMFQYRTHLYDNGKLSISKLIIAPSGIFDERAIQVIYYLYDENGNLIMESAEQSNEIQAWISYFNRYEYY